MGRSSETRHQGASKGLNGHSGSRLLTYRKLEMGHGACAEAINHTPANRAQFWSTLRRIPRDRVIELRQPPSSPAQSTVRARTAPNLEPEPRLPPDPVLHRFRGRVSCSSLLATFLTPEAIRGTRRLRPLFERRFTASSRHAFKVDTVISARESSTARRYRRP